MKVLVLNGSPRGERSNTLKITKSFLKGLGNENEVNIINVSKTEIAPCLGCFACWGKTPGKCVIKDDMEKLIELYLEADMVIWSFPLYYYGMPSKLKALLDRLLPTNLPTIEYSKDSISNHPQRYDLRGRKNMVISTCGFPSLKGNYEPLTLQLKYIFPENLTSRFKQCHPYRTNGAQMNVSNSAKYLPANTRRHKELLCPTPFSLLATLIISSPSNG